MLLEWWWLEKSRKEMKNKVLDGRIDNTREQVIIGNEEKMWFKDISELWPGYWKTDLTVAINFQEEGLTSFFLIGGVMV